LITRASHQMMLTPHGAWFDSRNLSLGLATMVPLKNNGRGIEAAFALEEGEASTFVLREIRQGDESARPSLHKVNKLSTSHLQ
jgi:hypothetical protein